MLDQNRDLPQKFMIKGWKEVSPVLNILPIAQNYRFFSAECSATTTSHKKCRWDFETMGFLLDMG